MNEIETASWLIRVGVGLVMIVYGLHQLIKPAEWHKYLPAWLNAFSPLSQSVEIRLHGIGNLFLGVWFAIGFFPVTAGWVTLVWWLTILPTVWKVDWTSFFRDLAIIAAIGAYIVLVS